MSLRQFPASGLLPFRTKPSDMKASVQSGSFFVGESLYHGPYTNARRYYRQAFLLVGCRRLHGDCGGNIDPLNGCV